MYEIHESGTMLSPQLLNTVVESAKHYPGYLTTKSYHCQALHMSIAYVANYKHNISYSMESRNELSLALCCTNWYADESPAWTQILYIAVHMVLFM